MTYSPIKVSQKESNIKMAVESMIKNSHRTVLKYIYKSLNFFLYLLCLNFALVSTLTIKLLLFVIKTTALNHFLLQYILYFLQNFIASFRAGYAGENQI